MCFELNYGMWKKKPLPVKISALDLNGLKPIQPKEGKMYLRCLQFYKIIIIILIDVKLIHYKFTIVSKLQNYLGRNTKLKYISYPS